MLEEEKDPEELHNLANACCGRTFNAKRFITEPHCLWYDRWFVKGLCLVCKVSRPTSLKGSSCRYASAIFWSSTSPAKSCSIGACSIQ